MTYRLRWVLVGLGVAISAAAACTTEEGPDHAAGGEGNQAGNGTEAGNTQTGSGGTGGDDHVGGGAAGTAPEATCGVALGGAGGDFGDARLTRQLPDQPFVLEPYSGDAYDESAYPEGWPDSVVPGPWTLHLEPRGAGLSGQLVIFNTSVAEKVVLEREGDHYRFLTRTTLVNYTYGADVVPGICLDYQAKASLLDDDGDCVADRLVIGGSVRSLGQRGGDYENNCGSEYFPIHLEARALSQSDVKPPLEATSDPLRPELYAPALYTQATATLETEGGMIIDAEPLLVDKLIYGFRANVGLAPGSKATWHLEGKALAQAGSQAKQVSVTFSGWPIVADGTFETWDGTWAQQALLSRNDPAFDPPIAGMHSLALAGGGAVASLRFVQPAGKIKLRFLADAGSFASRPSAWVYGLAVDYAAYGEAAVSGVPETTNVCDAHPDYCNCDDNQSCERELFDYVLDIPASAEPRELLLRFKNYNGDWALAIDPILIDDLRFE